MSARKRPRRPHRPRIVPPVQRYVPEPIVPSGHRITSWPWCVWCDQPIRAGIDHSPCREEMSGSMWVPCLSCLGGGIAPDRGGCEDCGGFGFKPANGPMHVWLDLDDDEEASGDE